MADFLSGAQKLSAGSPTTPSPAPDGGGSGSGIGSMPLSSLTLKGLHFTNPAAPTTARNTSNQQLSQSMEDAQDKLNILKKMVDADKASRKASGGIDELIANYAGVAGQKMGLKTQRSQIAFGAAQLRTRFNALQRQLTGFRSYQAVKDVQEHMPFATDTDDLLDEKIQMWQDAIDAANKELKERGIPVYQQSNVPMPEGSKGDTPKVSLPRPPFRVKYMDATSTPPRATDDAGNGWYLDPENHQWVQLGK